MSSLVVHHSPLLSVVVLVLVSTSTRLSLVGALPGDSSAAVKRDQLFFKAASRPETERTSAGRNVVLECEAGGSPSPTLHWLRGGQRIHQGHSESWTDDEAVYETMSPSGAAVGNMAAMTSSLRIGSTRSRLYLDCVTPMTSSAYVCVAETPTKRVSKEYHVQVEPDETGVNSLECLEKRNHAGAGRARIFMWTSHRIDVDGSDVQLFCRADGDPLPTISWYDKNGDLIAKDNSRYEVLHNGDLLVRSVNWSDNMGLYKCVAHNDVGTDSVQTFLYPTKAK